MVGQGQFEPMMDVLRALAEPTRLQLVWALSTREHSVSELAELVGAHVAAVSQHLAKLREAGLVATRRDGTRIFYRAATPHLSVLLDQLVVVSGHVSGELDLPQPAPPAAPATGTAAAAARRTAASRARPARGRPHTAGA
ncbi:metalloregulator ArsR/SmtB family transcription factor [Dactylosporangium sp. AC04546]|uniref:ArsR/SmtB family transcription factor n=1 Tax=Dactylosporangium sp. AC04546 TaxID=2862460 RepID=UPI00271481DC|nr:metalloregulator ArsR/SmtB family transcription factor [Dactylosporangium sp. AC04546]WVK80823.1 metalloregulator ArsR/SmtB family transcription factor [Dactylosporangium sp. AC04546]